MGNELERKRIGYLDTAKGIGMLCVILAHSGNDTVIRIISSFHMPLFFIISGYLISDKDSFGDYARKRTKQLMLPYLFTSVVICLCRLFTDVFLLPKDDWAARLVKNIGSFLYGMAMNVYNFGYAGFIWFLPAMLTALLIVKYFGDKKYGAVIIAAIAYLGYATSKICWIPMSIQPGCAASVFVYIGYILKKERFLERKISIPLLIFSVIMLVFEAAAGVTLYASSIYYSHGMLSIIGAVIICYSVICATKFINSRKNRLVSLADSYLAFLGKYTLAALCFHNIDFLVLRWVSITEGLEKIGISGTAQSVYIIVLKICWATMGAYLAVKIPLLRKIFGIKTAADTAKA